MNSQSAIENEIDAVRVELEFEKIKYMLSQKENKRICEEVELFKKEIEGTGERLKKEIALLEEERDYAWERRASYRVRLLDANAENAELKRENEELKEWKKSAKILIKNLTPSAPPRYDELTPAYSAY